MALSPADLTLVDTAGAPAALPESALILYYFGASW